jgi:hypothetical protein
MAGATGLTLSGKRLQMSKRLSGPLWIAKSTLWVCLAPVMDAGVVVLAETDDFRRGELQLWLPPSRVKELSVGCRAEPEG